MSCHVEAIIKILRFLLTLTGFNYSMISLKNKTAQKGGGERRVEEGGLREEDLREWDGGGSNEDMII